MSFAELFQTLQLIILFIMCIFITYHIVRSIKFLGYSSLCQVDRSSSKISMDYAKNLSVLDYQCYHKYQIWRFYLFSEK